MTDQSKPGRQDGDGLLKAARSRIAAMKIAPCSGIASSRAAAEELERALDYLATPQTARDVAEGVALDRENHWRKLEGRDPASPKPAPSAPGHTDLMVTPESIDAFMEKNPLPAPDAMREALRVISTMAVCEHGEGAENLQQIVEACRDVASEALAAPVPPADGALEQDIKLIGTALSKGDHPGGVTQAFYRVAAAVRAPSGTVAAEPVAWQHRNIRKDGTKSDWMDCSDDHAKTLREEFPDFSETRPLYTWPVAWRAFCSKTGGQMINPSATKDLLIERADHLYAEHGYILQPLYAATPVRGDRETLAETIHEARFRPDRTPTMFAAEDAHSRAYCFRIADAILSLHVQPGAGEREAADQIIGETRELSLRLER